MLVDLRVSRALRFHYVGILERSMEANSLVGALVDSLFWLYSGKRQGLTLSLLMEGSRSRGSDRSGLMRFISG